MISTDFQNLQAGTYRREIDGLRAVAVLAVIAFHAGIPGVTGGFVGVDVFFVISGFLITGMLLEEQFKHGQINLVRFYTRRIRRLLPALLTVVVATLALGAIVLLPSELPRLGKSAQAAVAVVSNHHFLKYSGGYFDPSTDIMPLLHTWSLSVEEQYYLVWPLLITIIGWGARRFSLVSPERLTTIVLLLIFASSLGGSLWFSSHDRSVAFYLTPFRAWEFALGGLTKIAVGRMKPSDSIAGAVQVIGVVLICCSVLFMADQTLFSGAAVLVATTGAAAILFGQAFDAKSRNVAGRLLSSSYMVRIGLISYSWYLWHWPLLAITREYSLGERDLSRDGGIVLLSLVLAVITYRYIELPIRYRRPWLFSTSRGTLVAGAILSLLTILIAAGVMEWGKSASGRLDKRLTEDAAPILNGKCDEKLDGNSLAPRSECTIGTASRPTELIVWGDSHANRLQGMLSEIAEFQNTISEIKSWGACPPLLGVVPYKQGEEQFNCARHNKNVVPVIDSATKNGLKGVILAARWNAYLGFADSNPAAITSYVLRPEISSNSGANESNRSAIQSSTFAPPAATRLLDQALRDTIRQLTSMNLRVLLVAPVPELPFNGPHCLYRRSPAECTVPRSRIESRRESVMAVFTSVAKDTPGVVLWDPINEFCDKQTCYAERDGMFLYNDDNHISKRMSRNLYMPAKSNIEWLLARPK